MAETDEPKVCRILSLDGGGAKGFYCANNPTLYAIADAIMALKLQPANIRVVAWVSVYIVLRTKVQRLKE
jgi:hypothetical protein